MTRGDDVDSLIREALRAEDVSELDALGEPGLPEIVTEVFRGRLRWIGGKIWYWMQLDRIATVREIKRVELLVARLALELRQGGAG